MEYIDLYLSPERKKVNKERVKVYYWYAPYSDLELPTDGIILMVA